MAEGKTRGPKWPSLDLKEAIAEVQKVFDEETRNKMSREVLASHLGYKSLSGSALSKIGALRHYGLIEGSGDEQRVSDDAVALLMGDQASREFRHAVDRAFRRPTLFADILSEYDSLPSKSNLVYYLVKRGFLKNSAEKAADVFLSSADFAEPWSSNTAADENSGGLLDEDWENNEDWEEEPVPREEGFRQGSDQPAAAASPRCESDYTEVASGMLTRATSFKLFVSGPLSGTAFDNLLRKLAIDREIITSSDECDRE